MPNCFHLNLKTKTMKKMLFSMIAAGMLFSCNQPSTETKVTNAPIDSLVASWAYGWNNQDSAVVRNLFEIDALLTDDQLIANGIEEIAAKMISPNIRLVRNFTSSRLQEWTSVDRAGYTGTYELEIVINEEVVAKPKGVFTVNWRKTGTGAWKITTATIYSFVEQK
jgi:ketosteroid isomerase-like protein